MQLPLQATKTKLLATKADIFSTVTKVPVNKTTLHFDYLYFNNYCALSNLPLIIVLVRRSVYPFLLKNSSAFLTPSSGQMIFTSTPSTDPIQPLKMPLFEPAANNALMLSELLLLDVGVMD